MAWEISGVTQVQDALAACIVRLYLRSNGTLVDSVVSSAVDGTYTFTGLIESTEYDIVCINNTPNICPQISGPIQPVEVI